MHIVSHSLASLVHLISLNETSGKWVIFLEFVISCSLVITKNTSNGKVFTTGIKDDSSWLTLWRSHVNSTEIDGIVFAVEWNLKLEVISVVLGSISDLADKLSSMDGLTFSNRAGVGTFKLGLNNGLLVLLRQAGYGLLLIFVLMSSLDFSKLRIIHLVLIEKDSLINFDWGIDH